MTASISTARAHPGRRVRLGVATALLTVAAVTLVAVVLPELPTGNRMARWWHLAVGFAASELLVMRLGLRRFPTSYAFDGIVLVIGMFTAPPLVVVTTHMLGVAVALLVYRRPEPVRFVFNLAQVAVSTSLALWVFFTLAGAPPGRLRAGTVDSAWGAAMSATVTGALVSLFLVHGVTAVSERRRWLPRLRSLALALVVATTNTAMALLTLLAIAASSAVAWLVCLPIATLFLAYRRYVRENERRLHLDFIQRVGDLLRSEHRWEDAITNVLEEARRGFGATRVALRLGPASPEEQPLATVVDVDAPPRVLEPVPRSELRFAVGEAADRAGAAAPGTTGAVRTADLLAVPLVAVDVVVGELEINRDPGHVATFTRSDEELAVSLAQQVAMHLESARVGQSLQQLGEAQRQLRHQTFHDPLTGLANRSLLRDRMDFAIRAAARDGGWVTALLIDLDDFRTINDSLGHQAGDQLLVEVANRLQRCLRPGDTVARLGGDEFAVLLAGTVGHDQARQAAQRMLRALGEPLHLGGQSITVEASIGIAEAGDGDTSTTLLRNADAAMYRAKHRGKGQVQTYEESLQEAAIQRLELRQRLQAAVDDSQLTLHFQPLVELSAGRVIGGEALLRWRHPERGLLGPSAFIELAEENGMIVPIGRWVLRQSIAQLAEWLPRFPIDAPPIMSVNLSVRQLADPTLADLVGGLLEEFDMPGEALMLEITESALMADADDRRHTLDRLRDLGLRVAVDDFGTGYSSLGYLRRLPVDVLKISKSFVDDLDQSASGAAVVETIVKLAAALGLRTIAEGVERSSQLRVLRSANCDVGQGFLFGEGVPAATFSFDGHPLPDRVVTGLVLP